MILLKVVTRVQFHVTEPQYLNMQQKNACDIFAVTLEGVGVALTTLPLVVPI